MFLQQLINGLALGSTYALVAVGYSLVFGVLRLINFSNGSLYMLGAYIAMTVDLALNGNIVLAVIVSLLATGAAGLISNSVGRWCLL